MTKEINFTPIVQIKDTDIPRAEYNWKPGQFSVSFTGSIGNGNPGLVDVGTVEESVAFGDVTPGMVILYNTDDTNSVYYGMVITGGTGGDEADLGLELKPQGIPHIIWLRSGYTLRMQASGSSCKVLVAGFTT